MNQILNQKPAKLSRLSIILGTALQMYGFDSLPLGVISLIMNFGTFYVVATSKTPWLMWLTPVVFVVLLAVGLTIFNLFVYHVVIPHSSAYANYINCKNENPVIQKLDAVIKEQGEQRKMMEEIKENYENKN